MVHAEDNQVTKGTADKHATGSQLPITEPWLTGWLYRQLGVPGPRPGAATESLSISPE